MFGPKHRRLLPPGFQQCRENTGLENEFRGLPIVTFARISRESQKWHPPAFSWEALQVTLHSKRKADPVLHFAGSVLEVSG